MGVFGPHIVPAPATSGAPTDADYLVGTAQTGLSAEIVVGATPGGELGGTWASPTVDATHSGSAHADFVAKALADAKGDLIVASAADTFTRLAVGTNGGAPVADDSQSTGIQFRSGVARRRDFHVALGLITESWDIGAATANATLTSQAIESSGVYLYKGEVITNILVCVTNAATGAAPTGLYLGLWSSAATPVCLAATADLKSDAMWTSTGYKVAALSAPFTVTADGYYYAAILMNGAFGGTALQIIRNANSLASIGQIGSNPRRIARLGTGKTTMTAADTGTYTAAGGYWFGVS